MTVRGWRMVEFLTGMLDAHEREAVLGDMAESGEGVWRAVTDVLSLAGRRHVELWKSGRPWIALLGVAGLGGAGLSGFSIGLIWESFCRLSRGGGME